MFPFVYPKYKLQREAVEQQIQRAGKKKNRIAIIVHWRKQESKKKKKEAERAERGLEIIQLS